MAFRPLRWLLPFLTALFLGFGTPALANDHGDGGGAPGPIKFVTNLGNPNNGGRYIQIEVAFEAASPEVEHSIGAYKPKIQHAVLLLLSSQDAAKLLTLDGKRELAANIRSLTNKILDETEKTGVKEVLFTSFIIQ